MANYKTKSKWKSILCGILVVATLIGACAGIAAIAKKDTKTIGAGAFSRGGLDNEGEYIKTEKTLYTEEMFECKGLVITPDFESSVSFQAYFYNCDGLFLGSSEIYTETTRFKVPDLAKYARIVLIPDTKEDIKFFEVYKLAKNIEITVLKNQEFAPVDYYELAKLNTIDNKDDVPATLVPGDIAFYKGHYVGYDDGLLSTYSADNFLFIENQENVTVKLDCAKISKYMLTFGKEVSSKTYHIFFFDEKGNVLTDNVVKLNPMPSDEVIVDVPETAVYTLINVMCAAGDYHELPIVINEYLPR